MTEVASPAVATEYRSVDGSGNNLADPRRGAANSLMRRGAEGVMYSDGFRRPIDRGNERTISRRLFAAGQGLREHARPDTNMISVLFGQFLNHELEDNHFFGHEEDNNKSFPVPDSPYQFVWVLDPEDPIATFRGHNRVLAGDPCGVPFKPSIGKFVDDVFYPANRSSSYLELSQVYGAEEHIATALRAYTGGRLKHDDYRGTSMWRTEYGPVMLDFDVEYLPPNRETTGLICDTSFTRLPLTEVCMGGDHRTSENMGLLQMQVLFFREHNHQADRLAAAHPDWDDERLFQEAKRRTIAVWQHLLVDEWLPTVFGPDMVERVGPYRGYDPEADPSTSVAFATCALRYGHSSLYPYAPRAADWSVSSLPGNEAMPKDGTLPNVGQINNGISPMAHYALAGGTPEHVLRGMLATRAGYVDIAYHTAIHDIAFVSGGTDLLTLDLARGRDNGVPPYHVMRQVYGGFGEEDWDARADVDKISEEEKRARIARKERLERTSDFGLFLRISARDPENPTHDEQLTAETLRDIYKRADTIDPIVGMISEPHVEGSSVGPTMQSIIADQIRRSRDADRFWYENGQFDEAELREIKATTMKDLLQRHFDLDEVPDEAFRPVEHAEQITVSR